MTGVTVVIGGDDRSKGAWASASGSLKSFGAGIKSTLGVLRDLTIVGQGAARLFQSMGRAIGGTVEAARQAVNADVKLAAALAHTGQEVGNNLKMLRAWADARQAATGHDDEATKGLLAMGAQLGLTGQNLRDAVSAAQDWSIAMEVDAATAIKALALTASGGEAQLGRLKITVDENATSAEQFTQAVRQMKTGLSEAVGALPTSGLVHLKNVFGDIREAMGLAITSTKTFQGVVGFLREKLGGLLTAMSDASNLKAWAAAFDKIALAVLKAGQAIVVGILSVLQALVNMLPKLSRTFGVAMGELEQDVRRFGDELSLGAEGARAFFDDLIGAIERAEGPAAQGLEAISNLFKNVVPQKVDDKAIREQAEAMGTVYADVFTNAMVEGFDRNVGVSEAFKNLGSNARDAFVGQMGSAMFAPMKQSFGQLAQAIAAPFNIVGKVINDLIVAPVVNFVTTLIGQVLASIGLTSAASNTALAEGAVAGTAAIVAVGAQAAAMGIPLSAAAAAAAIASFGSALQFGPMAVGAIAAAQAAAAPMFLVPGLAEGGLMMPRPGHPEGRLFRGAEREPEWVIPLSKAGGMFGGGRGDSYTVILQAENLSLSEREHERQARLMARETVGQLRRARIGGRRRP